MPGLYDPPPPDFLTCTCSLEPAIHTQGLQLALGPRALGTLGPRYGRYSLQGSLRVCGLCTGLHMGPQPAPSKLASDWKWVSNRSSFGMEYNRQYIYILDFFLSFFFIFFYLVFGECQMQRLCLMI